MAAQAFLNYIAAVPNPSPLIALISNGILFQTFLLNNSDYPYVTVTLMDFCKWFLHFCKRFLHGAPFQPSWYPKKRDVFDAWPHLISLQWRTRYVTNTGSQLISFDPKSVAWPTPFLEAKITAKITLNIRQSQAWKSLRRRLTGSPRVRTRMTILGSQRSTTSSRSSTTTTWRTLWTRTTWTVLSHLFSTRPGGWESGILAEVRRFLENIKVWTTGSGHIEVLMMEMGAT